MLNKKNVAIKQRTMRILVVDETSNRSVVNNQLSTIIKKMINNCTELREKEDESLNSEYSFSVQHDDIERFSYMDDALLHVSKELLMETNFLNDVEKMIYAVMSVDANYFVLNKTQAVFLSKIRDFLCDNDLVDYNKFFVIYLSTTELIEGEDNVMNKLFFDDNLYPLVYLINTDGDLSFRYDDNLDDLIFHKHNFERMSLTASRYEEYPYTIFRSATFATHDLTAVNHMTLNK